MNGNYYPPYPPDSANFSSSASWGPKYEYGPPPEVTYVHPQNVPDAQFSEDISFRDGFSFSTNLPMSGPPNPGVYVDHHPMPSAYSNNFHQPGWGFDSQAVPDIGNRKDRSFIPDHNKLSREPVRQIPRTRTLELESIQARPAVPVIDIIDSDEDGEPKSKLPRLSEEVPDEIPPDERLRREDEIIRFWEEQFVRSGAGRSAMFPDPYYLKDVQDLDKRPFVGLKRLFCNVGYADVTLQFEDASKQESADCPFQFMARCRWRTNQPWCVGYGNTKEEAKNEAARVALISLFGEEEYESIVTMSKWDRYKGLDLRRINNALRRKHLISKYREARQISTINHTSMKAVSTPLKSSEHIQADTVTINREQLRQIPTVNCSRTQNPSAPKSSKLGGSLKATTYNSHEEASDVTCLQRTVAATRATTSTIQSCASSAVTEIIDVEADETLRNVESKTSEPADFAAGTVNSSPSKFSLPSEKVPSETTQTETGKFSFLRQQPGGSNSTDGDEEIGGSGTDLSEGEEEHPDYNLICLPSVRKKRMENSIIKFWLDRMPVFSQRRKYLNIFGLHKLRNLHQNAKKAVEIVFSTMTPRPKCDTIGDVEKFSVRWSWNDISVNVCGSTLQDAENDASVKFLKEFLGEIEYQALCQITEESMYADLDSERINERLKKIQDNHRKKWEGFATLKNPNNHSNFDFQLVNPPKRLNLNPVSISWKGTEENQIKSKLRAYNVKRPRERCNAFDKIAPLQNFTRLAKLRELEKNAVAALGSLFARVDEPCPVYTTVSYVSPKIFKVECVVRGKYFVAEGKTEEAAKNEAAVMALKFLLGKEKFDELNHRSMNR